MKKSMTKLTNEDRELLISDFLKKLGDRIKKKRGRTGLSQAELSSCLDVDQATLSRYERGISDMQASMIPLISTYCKFPMYELFPRDESEAILNTFAAAVDVVVERKERQAMAKQKRSDRLDSEKVLKGQIYDIGGEEVFVPARQHALTVGPSRKTLFREARIQTECEPYSDEEFCNYIRSADCVESVLDAGLFLSSIKDSSRRGTLKGDVADYIIDEAIINNVTRKDPSEASKRAYEYYRRLFTKTIVK